MSDLKFMCDEKSSGWAGTAWCFFSFGGFYISSSGISSSSSIFGESTLGLQHSESLQQLHIDKFESKR